MSIDTIIHLVGMGTLGIVALVASGFAAYSDEEGWSHAAPIVVPLTFVAIFFWPIALALLLIAAVGYLPYRVGKALAAAADRRQLRQDIEKRERIAALHDLRDQYPRDSLTWQILDDQIKNQ